MRKAIDGYEGKYEIDTEGNVYSIRRGIILSPYIQQNRNKGYFRVNLNPKKFMVHVLVARAFIPNPDNKPFVNHKDRDTFNNNVDNLEWCTSQENAEHALSVYYDFINPDGEKQTIFNLSKFCRENNLTQSLMWKVFTGKRKQHKGWTIHELT